MRSSALPTNPYRAFLDARGAAPIQQPLDLSSAFPAHETYRNYLMVITGRCGSTWFGRMLEDMRLVGAPNEWFNTEGLPGLYERRGAESLADYVHKTAALHPVFGMQINPDRLFRLGELIDLEATFAGFAFIDLRRRDFLSQGFSFARARKTGDWHSGRSGAVAVEDGDVWAMIKSVISQEQRADAWYRRAGIRPLRLAYEDIVADKSVALLRTLRHISRSGQAPAFEPPPERQKRLRSSEPDEPVLDFYRRHAALIETIHTDRQSIDIAALVQRALRR